jgi:tetratricopeptide (TPR) repeat protein
MSKRGTHPARALAAVTVVLSASLTRPLSSQAQHGEHALGKVDFPVSCSPKARAEFTRAVALLHHMTYPVARSAFEDVAKTDPKCAMAHWGVAMTLFQPLWPTRPGPAALRRGWNEVEKAKALQPPTERERMFVAAAEAFFLEPASSDYWLRIRRWEESSEKLYRAFPDDPEAATFYALAHLATTPANIITRSHADHAAEILTRVYARNADHPGVMHYLVHANDIQGRERELLDVTRKYDAVAPDNPHALHMPTHIYTRLGDWDAVVRGNQRAAKAALATPAGDSGQYVWDEFPHAVEYLVYAYLQQGADDKAAAEVKRLKDTERIEPSFKTAFHLASTQARCALERRAWNDAASIPLRQPSSLDWDRFTWAEAIERFARGLGNVRLGRLDDARKDASRLDTLEASTRKVGEDLFARNIQMLNLELDAWIAHTEHRADSAVALLRAAAELEATTPKHAVTPGPTLPADELLGDLLMEQKRFADALAAYKTSLELYPKRFNSLLGVARANRALGDNAAAREAYVKLLDVAGVNVQRAAVREARAFVGR